VLCQKQTYLDPGRDCSLIILCSAWTIHPDLQMLLCLRSGVLHVPGCSRWILFLFALCKLGLSRIGRRMAACGFDGEHKTRRLRLFCSCVLASSY
jgi:hypothetical protein